MQRILPAPRCSAGGRARDREEGRGGTQGSACGSGPNTQGLRTPNSQGTPERQSPRAPSSLGRVGRGLGDPDSLGPQRRAGSPGLPDRWWRASPAPAQTGFLATFRTKCQVQVQVRGLAPEGRGWGEPSPAAFVLRDKRSHIPLPGGAQQIPPPRPAAPRRSHLLLPPARRLCLGPGDPPQGHRKVLGLGAGEGGPVRTRGSLPGPVVPAANCAWSDGCPRGGKDPWRGSSAPPCAPPHAGPARPGLAARTTACCKTSPMGLRGARCRSRPLRVSDFGGWIQGSVRGALRGLFPGRLLQPLCSNSLLEPLWLQGTHFRSSDLAEREGTGAPLSLSALGEENYSVLVA